MADPWLSVKALIRLLVVLRFLLDVLQRALPILFSLSGCFVSAPLFIAFPHASTKGFEPSTAGFVGRNSIR